MTTTTELTDLTQTHMALLADDKDKAWFVFSAAGRNAVGVMGQVAFTRCTDRDTCEVALTDPN